MPAGLDTHLLLRAFADELARCGATDACTSPGSRCSPIVAALVRDGRLRCHSHIDERSAGFFAIGLARATARPVAITCTSGTAAANLAPAVHEAWQARVPLVVLTADRPPELREVGAGQVIDQVRLYGSAAKWSFEVDEHPATEERLRWMRALACRAFWTALEGRPGPVHINFSLREPLVAPAPLTADGTGRDDGAPWVRRAPLPPDPGAAGETLRRALDRARRPVVVCGAQPPAGGAGGVIARFAAAAGVPLLADPLSGARAGAGAVAHYDLLLRDGGWADEHRPDLVIRVGDLPTSKPLRGWLADASVEQVLLDPHAAWQDPAAVVGSALAADPGAALADLLDDPPRTDGAWLGAWRRADRHAATAIDAALGDELSEPAVARELGRLLPAGATLVVASSMPVRDVETFVAARDDPPRVLANRGANGIDGTVSTALGVAAAGEGPVVLLAGDVALAHDIGGLLAVRRLGVRATIVVLHNDGGGIFEFLPVRGEEDLFEEHVATPHGLDFAHAAALYGLDHARPAGLTAFRAALEAAVGAPRATIVEVRTDRAANLELHRRVADRVREAL